MLKNSVLKTIVMVNRMLLKDGDSILVDGYLITKLVGPNFYKISKDKLFTSYSPSPMDAVGQIVKLTKEAK